MADEDKPHGRAGKARGVSEGAKSRSSKGAGLRSRGFKDRPAGAGVSGGKGESRSRGFRDRPKGLAPRTERTAVQPAGEGAEPERIAKYLARAGVASRRDAERMIEAGRVTVDGVTLESPAFCVTGSETILIDGEPIPEIERTRLWLFHKPAGLVTTSRDPQGRPTVFESLPAGLPRVMSVGRLDINTEGLLLLTNDGGLARVLELPQTGWLRRYRVRAHGKIDPKRLDELKGGIAVDGVFYGAIEAEIERQQGANVWLSVALREGKNREVKNVLGALGLEVNRLIRVSYGPFQLGDLPEGAVLEIKGRTLRDQLGPKLIAEASANFEAPVRKAFSNKPVKSGVDEPPQMRVSKRGDWVTSSPGGREDRKGGKRIGRDEALSRLDTRKTGRGAGAPAGESDRQRHSRGANVWMAPGARPKGAKADAKRKPEQPPKAGRAKTRTPSGKPKKG